MGSSDSHEKKQQQGELDGCITTAVHIVGYQFELLLAELGPI